mmetsp:Transcript_509/g.1045  ORF Transcript_509/g.1045 Transcript_509/m.1045 type:complete len:236 (-) Transcript_509:99-806(-)
MILEEVHCLREHITQSKPGAKSPRKPQDRTVVYLHWDKRRFERSPCKCHPQRCCGLSDEAFVSKNNVHSINRINCRVIPRRPVYSSVSPSISTRPISSGSFFSSFLAPSPHSRRAAITFLPISSISKAFRAEKGRFIPKSSKTGSSLPETRTTKLPLPGFVLLISTRASQLWSAKYFCILPARVLNTDHCLQASMEIIFVPPGTSASETAGTDVEATLAALAFVAPAFFALASFR